MWLPVKTPGHILTGLLLSALALLPHRAEAAGKPSPEAIQALRRGVERVRTASTPEELREGARWLLAATRKGEPRAAYGLARMFLAGKGVPKDPARAKALLARSAELGYAPAAEALAKLAARAAKATPKADPLTPLVRLEHNLSSWLDDLVTPSLVEECEKAAAVGSAFHATLLGMIHEFGIEREPSPPEAEAWYRQAADAGSPEAMRHLGILALGTPGHDEAATMWLGKAAAAGDTLAMAWLGTLHTLGRGVAKDAIAAEAWFERAAREGLPVERYLLGLRYREGSGTHLSPDLAHRWLVDAAPGLSADQQYRVGALLWSGDGVPVDRDEGRRWIERAATRGDPLALRALEGLRGPAPPVSFPAPGVRVAEAIAGVTDAIGPFARKLQALANGTEEALQQALAELLPRPALSEADLTPEGLVALEARASDGDLGAMVSLGMLHQVGQGASLDLARSARWFERAAARGDARARFHLGQMHLWGLGVAQDPSRGLELLRAAAGEGDPAYAYFLGLALHLGQGVRPDPREALVWMKKAGDAGLAQARDALLQLEGAHLP